MNNLVSERERARKARADAERIRARTVKTRSRSERLQDTIVLRLYDKLESMPAIEQAKGILMARHGCSADEAFDMLRKESQRTHVKVRDLAARIVEQTQQASQD